MSLPVNTMSNGKSTAEDTIFDNATLGKKSNKNFKVCIRVRPLIQREIESREEPCIEINSILNTIAIYKPKKTNPERNEPISTLVSHNEGDGATTEHTFSFDKTFSAEVTQADLYSCSIRPVVLNILEGYNGTIIAYGQTSAGKTYTMEGSNKDDLDCRGIIPRAAEDIFSYIERSSNAKSKFLVRASFLQIYNEILQDLLDPRELQSNQTKKEPLKIREYPHGNQVQGLIEEVVRSPNDIVSIMKRGSYLRTTASTKLNPFSSRSHAIFSIIVEHAEISTVTKKQMITIGKLNLVDLAGSERVKESGAEGRQFEEACKINSSLTALGKVILSLTSQGLRSHIPYRDSKVTLMLRDSLGGNCRTTLITNITPASSNYSESLGTLRFANTAKSVKNDAKVNQDMSEQGLLLAYEKELQRLKAELAKAAGAELSSSQGSNKLRQLKSQLEGANIEKKAIQDELIARENEITESRMQQESLVNKISHLENQLLTGGQVASTSVRETEEFKVAIEEVEQQMKGKVDELSNENQSLKREKEALKKRESDLISKLENINFNRTSIDYTVNPTQVTQVEEIQEYLNAMCHPQSGIKLVGSDLSSGFTGYSACMWFMSNILGIDTPEKASQIGQQLVEYGVLQSSTDQSYFIANDNIFYFDFSYLTDISYLRRSYVASPVSPTSLQGDVISSMDGRMSGAFSRATNLSDLDFQHSGRDLRHTSQVAPHAYSAMSMAPDVLSESLSALGGGITALHSAAYKGDKVLVKQLVPTHGVDCRDLQGRTPLIFAAMGGRGRCVEMLFRLGANVGTVDNNGRTSLLWAAYYGHFDVIRYLIKSDKSIVNCIDPDGRTALHWATKPENPQGLRVLIKYCKPELILARDKDNSTALIWAVLCVHPDHLSLLLKQCSMADPKICDSQGHNALHYAVSTGQEACCDIILRHSQDIAACPDCSGRLPAHLATENGSLGILHKIISLAGPAFCGVNSADNRQATPLHWASALNRVDMVKLLIEAGADINTKDVRGFTPLHYALQKNFTEIIQVLEEGTPTSS